MITRCYPHLTRKLGVSKNLKNQQLTRSAQSYVEQILLGDPNYPFCPAVAGMTLWGHHTRVKGALIPNLWGDNLGKWIPLSTGVNHSLT